MKNFISSITRSLEGYRSPSKDTNSRLLEERGETIDSFTIREVRDTDLKNLAALHVKGWNETYLNVKNPPNFATREYQWKEQFKTQEGDWFCFVVEDQNGRLVGFAKGCRHTSDDFPGYEGEVSKIYVLRDYQRLGLGKKLVGYVTRRFLSQGVKSMVLFGVPQNSSSKFHELLGGQKLYNKSGEFFGGYGLNDLQGLATMCPIN